MQRFDQFLDQEEFLFRRTMNFIRSIGERGRPYPLRSNTPGGNEIDPYASRATPTFNSRQPPSLSQDSPRSPSPDLNEYIDTASTHYDSDEHDGAGEDLASREEFDDYFDFDGQPEQQQPEQQQREQQQPEQQQPDQQQREQQQPEQQQSDCDAFIAQLIHYRQQASNRQPVQQQPDLNCTICTETYLGNHPLVTKCGHIFCAWCLTEWFVTKIIAPAAIPDHVAVTWKAVHCPNCQQKFLLDQ